MKAHLLGIDSGGTSTKAALFTLDGTLVGSAGRAVATSAPRAGWSERDADALWADTADSIREVLRASGIPAASIAALACTGHGNGLYLTDAEGRPARPAINSNDQRAQSIVDGWRRDGTEARAMAWTAQRLWAAQPPALLAWLRQHEPAALARAHRLLMCKDFIRLRLTGQTAAELTDASGASLLDVNNGQWSDELLRCLGLADCRDLLPALLQPHGLAGKVTAEAAAQTGLLEGTPVAGGMFDIDACCLASGVLDETVIAMVAGTWGNCLSVSPHPVADPAILMTSCFALLGRYLLLEGSPTSGGNLDWALANLNVSSYAEAERLAVGAPLRGDSPFFLPFLYGTHGSGAESACFLGLRSQTTTGALIGSVYEATAFAMRFHLEKLAPFRATMPRTLRLSGGAARSAFWSQVFADVMNVPVEIPDGDELGAKGAAMAAAIAIGLHADWPQAAQAMVSISRTHAPQPDAAALLDSRYQRYRAILTSLAPLWPHLGIS